jgi:hypothetical protein
MSKANKADLNWRSFVGPEDNGRTITADEWSNPPDPENWDDAIRNWQAFYIDKTTGTRKCFNPDANSS